MGFFITSTAAATAVVGYDLLLNSQVSNSSQNRVLRGVALTGSAAIGDAAIDVYIDSVRVATVYNSKLLAPNMDDVLPVDDLIVPAGAIIHAYVIDAPATNPLFCGLSLSQI